MINTVSTYSSVFVRSVKSLSRHNYDLFQLSNTTHTWIISLGIRKRLRTTCYRKSKARTKLFYHINTFNKSWASSDKNWTCNQMNLGNLIFLTIKNNRGVSAVFSHINARSIYPKILTFQQHISMVSSPLCAITETWLQNDKDDLRYKEVPPLGYSILSHPWSDGRRGGGIAVVHKKNLKVKDETPTQTSKIMEYMKVKACLSGVNFNVYVVYRFLVQVSLVFVKS